MSTAAYIVAALSALWIDYGWQPLAGGGHEYIIQVPPELIDTLRTEGIESYVPPEVHDIRRIRIAVGSEALPQRAGEVASGAAEAAREQITVNKPPAAEPDGRGGVEAEARTAKFGSGRSEDPEAERSSSAIEDPRGLFAGLAFFGFNALTLAEIALGIAAAVIVFLVWAHLSMRARYRALLHRVHDPMAAG